jgi:hypothetical protein
VCLDALPTAPVTITNDIDTTTDSRCLTAQPGTWTARQPDACFIVGTTITLTGNTDVDGGRPLVLLATDTLTISGEIDAAARNGKVAPAAPFLNCGAFPQTPQMSMNGGGGGAGGSFVTRGGDGGRGDGNNTNGGISIPMAGAPTGLRAGCPGQNGAMGDVAGGVGGGGGGVVYLVAGNLITIGMNGIVNASGAGGRAGDDQSGGGGGGSGGMIVLHAAMIDAAQGRLLANGGGGASGAPDGNNNATDGNDPSPMTPLVGAAAVTGPAGCCAGGAGFGGAVSAATGTQGNSNQSGGGGGGAGGYIQSSHGLGTEVSPMPVIVP